MAFDPDQYLAEKTQGFDPDAYLAAKGLSAEDPGVVKSTLAGIMSGIPLAETATAGLTSALGDKTYEEEHKALEDLRDKAWEKHPVAYGSGKGLGIAGTTLLAPESTAGRIALAAGMGAGSGVDASENTDQMLGNAAKGAAIGTAIGGLGEGASKVISKVLPKVGKGVLSSMTGGAENVDTYLADRAGVNAAIPPVGAAEKLASGLNTLDTKANGLSDEARSLLQKEATPATVPIKLDAAKPSGLLDSAGKELMQSGPLDMSKATPDTLSPIFDSIKSRFTQNGVANTPANEAAVNALNGQFQRMVQMAKDNGGRLSEPELKQTIVDLQKMLSKNVFDNPDVSATKEAMKQLSGALNGMLKESNPAYGEAMKPVADLKGMISDVKGTFKPDVNDAGEFINSDLTNSKMGNVLKDTKTNQQELLSKFGDLTGFDFVKNAKLDQVRQALESGNHSSPVLNVAGHALGYGAGALSNIPGGRLIGSLLGGAAAHALDGGAVAKSIMDTYLNGMERVTNSGLKAAYQKYAPMLIAAAKQGGNQLAATHFVLATSHPEYQALADHATQEQSDKSTSAPY